MEMFNKLQDNVTALFPELTRIFRDLNATGLLANGTLTTGKALICFF